MLLCIQCNCRLCKLFRAAKGYILIAVLVTKCSLATRKYFRFLQLQIVLSVCGVKVQVIPNVSKCCVLIFIICGMPSSECGRQIFEGIISFKSRCDYHVISVVSVESLLNLL